MRSSGGWLAAKSLRWSGEKALTEERISRTDYFVEIVLSETNPRTRHLLSSLLTGRQMQQIIAGVAKKKGIQCRNCRGKVAVERSREFDPI